MGEYAPIIIALAIIVLIVLVIHLGVSYAFQIYENRRLQEEINKGFHYTIGFNQSLAKDVKFLEDELRPYRCLANKYGCGDAMELEKLLMDLQDRRAVQGGIVTRKELEEWAVENEVELVFLADGDDAIVGLGNDGQGFHVIYSMQKFIDSLVRSGMTEEDAHEWYSYNTIASIPSMGANRPIMLES